jgi:hypothetical protein
MEKSMTSRFAPVAPFHLVVALLAVLAGTTVAGAQGTDPLSRLDHFKCYRVTHGTPANAFVQLQDQFDEAISETFFEHVVVQSPLVFCNPVNKTLASGQVTPIVNENNHLKMYLITPTSTQTRIVTVANQFTGSAITTLQVFQPVILAVPTQKRPHGPPERLDHFKCYLVRGDPVNLPVGLVDQFDKEQVRVGRPLLLCNPTVKIHGSIIGAAGDLGDNETPITNKEAHLVCYRIISSGLLPATGAKLAGARERAVQVLNQFDKEIIKVAEPILLCVPSTKFLTPAGN